MKTFNSIMFFVVMVAFASCSRPTANVEGLKAEIDSLKSVIGRQDAIIKDLRDSVSVLKFPADQRLAEIKRLIASDDLSAALNAIAKLKDIFPNSVETEECIQLVDEINAKIAAVKAEQERIKAQGFKVFKDNMNCKDNDENYAFSGFSFGRTFTFDNCSDVGEYSYRTADKDNTYLLFSLRMSTQKKYATPPYIYIYELQGDKLKKITMCSEEYASWTSYGAMIGNYNDDSHDFSKVNSVNYKFAGEIDQSLSKKPLFVLFAKNGHNLADELSIENVQNDCIVIKVMNRGAI